MSNASRKVRGMATQAFAARFLKLIGLYPWATDQGSGRPGQDILNTPGASIEMKARAGFEPVAALKQACMNCTDEKTPIVVMRMNGQGPKAVLDWVAFTTFGEMAQLLAYKKACLENKIPVPDIFEEWNVHRDDEIED